jgi:hypothetical protein
MEVARYCERPILTEKGASRKTMAVSSVASLQELPPPSPEKAWVSSGQQDDWQDPRTNGSMAKARRIGRQ